MADRTRTIRVVDSHTAGEPTRVVIDGGPDLGGGSIAERRDVFRTSFDLFRSAVVNEPRGSDPVVGALLCAPSDPACAAGVIFFNNVGYLGMCGHGTIGLVVTLAHLGRIGRGIHRIETPVGVVSAELHDDGTVSVANVPSYRHRTAVVVEAPPFGTFTGDVAWGGNWFFLTAAGGETLDVRHAGRLTEVTWAIRTALAREGVTGADGAEIDHIELFGPPDSADANSRNFVLCPGRAYDRSPCGTGTSAKLACLAADGRLRPGEVWRQESVVGTLFEGSFRVEDGAVLPTIRGGAFVNAEATLIVDERDPFCWGHPMSRVVIAGGGVIGLCTAWYAAARGHQVTVVDRGPRMHPGCSWGNAGMITPSHFVPLSAPGIVRTALKWMFDDESPFYVRPRLDTGLLSWGVQFARHANAAHVERSAPLLLKLNLAGLAGYRELSEQWGRPFGLVERGMLMLCATEHGLEDERRTAGFAHRLGIAAEILGPDEIAELEPDVRFAVAGGAYYPDDAIFTPKRFMQSIIERLEVAGVDLRWETEATRFRTAGDRVTAVDTPREAVEGDEFVLCGGSWSPSLLRALGLRLPMQAGKGYSLTLPRPRTKPSRGVILTEGRVAVTPMGEELRFGGTMEMAGIDERIHPARVRGIVKSACRCFPEFTAADFDGIEPWCGLRPCSPDGLPYVGRFRRFANLSTASGHAMMGMSLGPVTGRLMAELLSGDAPSIDVSALSPDRYA